MQFTTATTADLKTIEKLWTEIFGDTPQFAHFAANICKPEEIYLIRENDDIAAMVIAGLMAQGTTEIEEIHHIQRGYDNIIEKLRSLGADIELVTTPDDEKTVLSVG